MMYLGVPKFYEGTVEKLAVLHEHAESLSPPPQSAFERMVAIEITGIESWLRSHMMWMVQLVG